MGLIDNDNALGELLTKIAREKGLSLRRFASILGISHAYLDRLMAGVNSRNQKPISPTIHTLLKIADRLKIPRIEFLRLCKYIDNDAAHNSGICNGESQRKAGLD